MAKQSTENAPAVNLRDQFLSVAQVPQETVHISELGQDVLIKGRTAQESEEFQSSVMGENGEMNIVGSTARTVIAQVYDPETGEKVFSPQDETALNNAPASLLNKIFRVVQKLSGEQQGAKEENVKN